MTKSRRLLFVGVSPASSSIMTLFPLWADMLGLDACIEAREIPLGADPQRYRAVVDEIAACHDILGALVTSHKVQVYEHARDLFDELDELARACREVSCISKREQRVVGHAKDPASSGSALDEMLGASYWRERDRDALILGAGGAGTAITARLLSEDPGPRRIVVTDGDPARLERLRLVHARPGQMEYREVTDAAQTDDLIAGLAPGSLVVNATGMGKDLPGSPITNNAAFPRDAVIWELNYRGGLQFLQISREQGVERGLRIHDGWTYFLHGWKEVIAEVFALDIDAEAFARMAALAERFRPAS